MTQKEFYIKRNEITRHLEDAKALIEELQRESCKEEQKQQVATKEAEDGGEFDVHLYNYTMCKMNYQTLSHAIREIDTVNGFISEVTGIAE